jgi:outer membrane lipoprotein-sorting protein
MRKLDGLSITKRMCALALAAIVAAASAQAPPPQQQKPQRVKVKLDGFDLSSSGKSGTQASGASRGGEKPLLYAPLSGKCYTLRPEFHWITSDPSEKVIFTLSTLDGTAIYEGETSDDHVKYPADAAALTPGTRYRWTIAPANEMVGGPAAPVELIVIGGPERDGVESQLKAAQEPAAQAQVFVDHRIWYDAIERYSAILAQKPDDTEARTMRAELYDQLSATQPLAEADWKMVH